MEEKLALLKTHENDSFKVMVAALPEYDLDLSFDEDGTVAAALETGELIAFCAAVFVYYKGVEIGSSYLGNCIYKRFEDFLDSGYLKQMTAEAADEARRFLKDTPTLRDVN